MVDEEELDIVGCDRPLGGRSAPQSSRGWIDSPGATSSAAVRGDGSLDSGLKSGRGGLEATAAPTPATADDVGPSAWAVVDGLAARPTVIPTVARAAAATNTSRRVGWRVPHTWVGLYDATRRWPAEANRVDASFHNIDRDRATARSRGERAWPDWSKDALQSSRGPAVASAGSGTR